MRNVEIKARILNFDNFLKKAKDLSNKPEIILFQTDTYFKITNGRLKLREIQNEKAELIFYERPNVQGPKLSNHSKQEFQNPSEVEGLKKVLSSSLDVVGVVNKKRHLFMYDRTRIHVDNVDFLGHFMELEVLLHDDETVDQGQHVANELMSRLGVLQSDLISGSYIDMLIAKINTHSTKGY